MHEHIIKQLKSLQTIEPDNGFVFRTRNLFVPATIATVNISPRPFSIFNWQYASAFALVLISVIVIPFFMFTPEETLASLDTQALTSEIHSLPINVQLEELKYNETAQETITTAVSEASNTDTNHLNTSLIRREGEIINAINEEEVETNVDDLLNQVIQ